MKKQTLTFLISMVGAFMLVGCSSQPTVGDSQPAMSSVSESGSKVAHDDGVAKPEDVAKSESATVTGSKNNRQPQLIKITGTGFGSESSFEGYSTGQRRLMAIRASKLDAYRSLAEQLYGVKIDSNTQLSTLTARNDNFRARVNAIVKGARVVSVTPMPDNNYETVLEVYVDRGFFNNHFVYTNCPDGSCNVQPVEPDNLCGNGYGCQSVEGR